MLISDQYREQNALLHEKCRKFGSNGWKGIKHAADLAIKYGGSTVLDYGSGKGTLKEKAPTIAPFLTVYQYEPAMGIDERRPCDVVICRDVLEHIEPECLDDVLLDLRRLTLRAAHLLIATKASNDILPDGRNAHLIIQPRSWWAAKLAGHFNIIKSSPDEKANAWFEVTPK